MPHVKIFVFILLFIISFSTLADNEKIFNIDKDSLPSVANNLINFKNNRGEVYKVILAIDLVDGDRQLIDHIIESIEVLKKAKIQIITRVGNGDRCLGNHCIWLYLQGQRRQSQYLAIFGFGGVNDSCVGSNQYYEHEALFDLLLKINVDQSFIDELRKFDLNKNTLFMTGKDLFQKKFVRELIDGNGKWRKNRINAKCQSYWVCLHHHPRRTILKIIGEILRIPQPV